MSGSSSALGLLSPLLNRQDEPHQAKYLSSLEDTSPMGRTHDAPLGQVTRQKFLLEQLGSATVGPPGKPKRRRNIPLKQPTIQGLSTGTVFAMAIGESIDIGWIESKWQERRDARRDHVGGDADYDKSYELESLLGDGLVETAISIEKQVSYWKVFDGLDCFVFAFGSIVAWDVSENQLEVLRSRLMPFVSKPVAEPKRDKVIYTSANSRLELLRANDTGSGGEEENFRLRPKIIYGNIQLTSNNSFEKLAYSYAIAQSVRLDVFEDDIANAISATSQIPIHLAKLGSVGLSNRAVTIKMGELFLQRSNVNLHSDILDTPELFWEFDEYEQMYILGREYLDIDKRIEILNQRLDIMKDLYEMLQNELNVKHSAKIEMIIIVLILAEIILQVFGMVLSWMTGVAVFER